MANKDDNDNVIICRCEEVTRREILEAIEMGCRTVDEVKRMTRAGMGPCQGRTCGGLVARIISDETGIPLSQLEPMSVRFPVRPLRLSAIADSTGIGAEEICIEDE